MTWIPTGGSLNLADWLGRRWGVGACLMGLYWLWLLAKLLSGLEKGGYIARIPHSLSTLWHFSLKHSISQKDVSSCGQEGWNALSNIGFVSRIKISWAAWDAWARLRAAHPLPRNLRAVQELKWLWPFAKEQKSHLQKGTQWAFSLLEWGNKDVQKSFTCLLKFSLLWSVGK